MRSWQVGGAVIEGDAGLLLVQNKRRDGRLDWSTPGGVIDPGETVLEGLAREVAEETGLMVAEWSGPVYDIEVLAPDLGWDLRVEVHRAASVRGELVIDDPDGIVVDARYVATHACGSHLEQAPVWVREPLHAWLAERWEAGRTFRYRVDGKDLRSLVVTALP